MHWKGKVNLCRRFTAFYPAEFWKHHSKGSTVFCVRLFTGDMFQAQFLTMYCHEFHGIKCQISSTKMKQHIFVLNLETFFLNVFINTSVFLQAFILFLSLVWEPSDQVLVQEHMWDLSEHWRQHRLKPYSFWGVKPCSFWGGDFWTTVLWGEYPCLIVTLFSEI